MHIFITGGAGFVGCNLAAHHLAQGNCVTVYDNLSRPRTDINLRWLQVGEASSSSPLASATKSVERLKTRCPQLR